MSRARRLDLVLVALLTPLWLLCVFLHVRLVWNDRLAWVPIHVTPMADGPPTVVGVWPGSSPQDVGLEPGDRLLSLAGTDLRGVGRLRLLALAYGGADETLRVKLRIERGDAEQDAALQLRRIGFPWRTVPLVVGLGLMGLLLPLRGSGARAARAWALAGVSYSLHWSLLFGPPVWQTYLGAPLFLAGATLFPPLLLRACLLTPDPVVPRGRIATAWTWVLAVNGVGTASWLLGVPFSGDVGLRIIFSVNFLLAVGAITIVARNYRKADAIGRRQLKWVLFGVYIGAAPVLFAAALGAIDPDFRWLYELSLVFMALTPFCIFIAFVRFNFLDIDRLLSATAAFSLLSVVLLSVLFAVVPILADLLARSIEIERRTVQTMLWVAVAAVLVPAERFVRPPIERIFFRERIRSRPARRRCSPSSRVCRSPARYSRPSAGGSPAPAPRTCVVYGHAEPRMRRCSARPAVPPGFDAKGPLVDLLEAQARPSRARNGDAGPGREPQGRRPRRPREPGPRRAAADPSRGSAQRLRVPRPEAVRRHLHRRPQRARLRSPIAPRSRCCASTRRDRARRRERSTPRCAGYVPGAVATSARGVRPAPGEREVSVLVRGRARLHGFSGRRPEEIFRTVERLHHHGLALVPARAAPSSSSMATA